MEQVRRQRGNAKQTAIGLSALVLALAWLRCPEHLAEAVRDGLSLCATTMIPALFPFMVLSELIVSSGIGRRLGYALRGLFGPLFGLSEGGVCAWVMGLVCGFPIGARVAASLYRSGEMDAREFCHVICFCNVPSSAFLVGVMGSSLLGSRRAGWCLVGWTVVACAAVGILFRGRGVRSGEARVTRTTVQRPSTKQLLGQATASAATSMLGVCATVVIFCAILATLSRMIDARGASPLLKAGLFGLTELSAGARAAAALPSRQAAAVLCAAVAGWGGFSVHCQILSVCDGCPVSLTRFYACRVLQTLMSAAGMALSVRMGLV